MILPGATLGILGGGQLGRMFVMAARTMGYQVIVLDPDPGSPAGQLANAQICADYGDRNALDNLARSCAAITTEFENVPATSLAYLATFCPVRPSAAAVAITQDRIKEKNFLRDNSLETARYAVIEHAQHFVQAINIISTPALLKLSRMGYDGKGQKQVRNLDEAKRAFAEFGQQPCVLEELVAIQNEVSVVIVRSADGNTVAYSPCENWHIDGILHMSVAPARISPALADAATKIALNIAVLLNYCGVMAVEFFVLHDGRLLVNEIAPRPHNTGHHTLDACLVSQFEQQVRVLCDLPLGDTTLLRSSAMVNILGDLWHEGHDPAWAHILSQQQTKLHLYGKAAARPGRKMGHYTCLADNVEAAMTRAQKVYQALDDKRVLENLPTTLAAASP